MTTLGSTAVAPRLPSLVRGVNRRIAAQAPLTVAAFACECSDPGCSDALEVPLAVFVAMDSQPGLYAVCPGHDDPAADIVVRRETRYVVVRRS